MFLTYIGEPLDDEKSKQLHKKFQHLRQTMHKNAVVYSDFDIKETLSLQHIENEYHGKASLSLGKFTTLSLYSRSAGDFHFADTRKRIWATSNLKFFNDINELDKIECTFESPDQKIFGICDNLDFWKNPMAKTEGLTKELNDCSHNVDHLIDKTIKFIKKLDCKFALISSSHITKANGAFFQITDKFDINNEPIHNAETERYIVIRRNYLEKAIKPALVIIHEIAHAMDNRDEKQDKHDEVFKEICNNLGAPNNLAMNDHKVFPVKFRPYKKNRKFTNKVVTTTSNKLLTLKVLE